MAPSIACLACLALLVVHVCSTSTEFSSEGALLQGLEEPSTEHAILSDSLQWMRTCIANSWWKAARAIVSRTHAQKSPDAGSSTLASLSSEVRALVKGVKQQADQFAEYADDTFRGHRQGLDDVPCALQWAQNSTTVFLAVKYASRWSAPGAIEIADVSVNITDAAFALSGFGHHSSIRKRYFVDLALYADVVPSRSTWSAASVGRATATIPKAQAGKWSRLTKAKDKSKHQITSWLDMEERWSEELKNPQPRPEAKTEPKAKAETTTPAPAGREKGQRVHTPMYKKVQRQLHKQMKRMSKFFSRGLPFVAIILGTILVGLAFRSYFAPAAEDETSEPQHDDVPNIAEVLAAAASPKVVSSGNNPLTWPLGKQAWCCEHHQTGCVKDSGFHCNEGDASAWAQDKRAYCCTAAGLGCTTQMPLEGQMFDCTEGYANWPEWPANKQSWCCEHHSRACPSEDKQYDCSTSESSWISEQREWCCLHHGKACAQ
ncbi:unnamed protein product [Symbiodinium sp. CCMP2456]|nr:unnamed protein product [Symbiodinium sp. CCMP2456]